VSGQAGESAFKASIGMKRLVPARPDKNRANRAPLACPPACDVAHPSRGSAPLAFPERRPL